MTSLQTSDPLEAALETIRQRRAAEIQANKDAYAEIWKALATSLEPWFFALLDVEISGYLYDIAVVYEMYTAEFRHQEDGWRVWNCDEQDYRTIPHADLQSWLLNDFVDQEEVKSE